MEGLNMATASFDKHFKIDTKEQLELFMDMWCDKTPKPPIDTSSFEEELKRGDESLKKYSSHYPKS